MTELYTDLARVYHEMYQVLFDYKAEFDHFHRQLQKTRPCHSVLEIGCGSGNLAACFEEAGYAYCGLDLSAELLAIARELNPRTLFLQADMRAFRVEKPFDALIVSGRSFGYLITNRDVLDALACFYNALIPAGVLVLDSFDAEAVIQKEYSSFTQEVETNGRKIRRTNRRRLNLESGFTWDWDAEYQIDDPLTGRQIIEDHSLLRAFTESELGLLLKIGGFKVIEVDRENQLFLTCRKTG